MTRLTIEGMSCRHCVTTVTEALAAVPGVAGTPVVTLEPGAARVEGNAAPEALIAAIVAAGYQARLADDAAPADA